MAATTSTAAPAVEASAAEASAAVEARKPKKAVSAYWLFASEVREEVTKELKAKENNKVGLGDVAKATTSRWAALTEADKKPYEDKAAEDKKRYAEELKAYLEVSDPAGTLRAKYAHLIPKKPMTPYFAFSQDPAQREKAAAALKEAGSEAGQKQLAAKLAELWKAASAEEKRPFEESHRAGQKEFLEKQKQWQATPEFAEIEAAVKKQAEQQKEEVQEAPTPSKAAKRSRSAAKAASPKEEPSTGAQPSPGSTSKRARKAPPAKEDQVAIDADVLADASKAGLEGMLRNLAARPEVLASGKSSRDIFKALQASGGLVNSAKRALILTAGA